MTRSVDDKESRDTQVLVRELHWKAADTPLMQGSAGAHAEKGTVLLEGESYEAHQTKWSAHSVNLAVDKDLWSKPPPIH